MRKIFFLFLFLFFFPFHLYANPIKSQYELFFLPEENLLKGKAIFELPKEEIYEFVRGEIKILSIELNSKPLQIPLSKESNTFKIFNTQKNSTLVLTFELNWKTNKSMPIQILVDYLPYPKGASIYEISVNTPDLNKLNLLIPSEESEEVKEKQISIFRIIHPIPKLPPIILGNLLIKSISLESGEIIFLLPKNFSEKIWKEIEKNLKREISNYPFSELLFPFKRLFLVNFYEKSTYPLVSLIPLTSKEYEEKIFESLVEQTLIYGLNFDPSPLFEGLKTYLIPYYFNSHKKNLRRKLLLSEENNSRAFFYIYEKIEKLGEKRFQNFFKTYLQKYLFNGSTEELFRKKFSELLEIPTIWEFKDFHRVKVAGTSEVVFLEKENKYALKIKLLQENFFRPVVIDIKIETEKDKLIRQVYMSNRETWFEILLPDKIKKVYIDPEYKIYRLLSTEEIPLNWERLFYSKGVIFLPKRDFLPVYREVLEYLREQYSIRYEKIDISTLPKENIIFFEELPLNFHLPYPPDGFYFKILPHPHSLNHFFAFIKIPSLRDLSKDLFKTEEVKEAQEFLIKRGKVLFTKEDHKGEGIKVNLKDKNTYFGVRANEFKTLDDIFFELLPAQIILIGEKHDEYSHHLFQLEVIKRFYQYFGYNIAIGLEMVQRPFQKYLDDFIEGKISEEELLEKIEYYERWKFDYRLYRDIFSFAKEKKIKLIALDLPQELVKKVFKEGLTNFSEEDKKFLPEMDLNHPYYKEFLRKVYLEHNFGNETNFEYFYQAQLLRDEGMAEEIVNFLRKNPNKKILVLVGKGHLQNKYGIPSAIKRRNFFNFKTIVLGEVEDLSPSIADYWFNPISKEYEKSPTLGVVLEEVPEGLKIKEVLKGSLAESLNLKAGDILLMADHKNLKKISDLKIILTFKNKGAELVLKIKRLNEISYVKGSIK